MDDIEKQLADLRAAQAAVAKGLREERAILLARVAKIDAALSGLAVKESPKPSRRGLHRGPSKKGALLSYLESNPGARWADVKNAVGIDPSQLLLLTRKGEVRREQSIGGYRYFLPVSEAAQ